MSLDKSLKTSAKLARHRNVLKRHERIDTLKDQDRWSEDQEPVGLPKVAHRKAKAGKKKAKAQATEEKTGEEEATTTPTT